MTEEEERSTRSHPLCLPFEEELQVGELVLAVGQAVGAGGGLVRLVAHGLAPPPLIEREHVHLPCRSEAGEDVVISSELMPKAAFRDRRIEARLT